MADQVKKVFDIVMDELCDRLCKLSEEVIDMNLELIECEEKGEDCMLCPERHYDNVTYNEIKNLKRKNLGKQN